MSKQPESEMSEVKRSELMDRLDVLERSLGGDSMNDDDRADILDEIAEIEDELEGI
jgi:hypothetical protein